MEPTPRLSLRAGEAEGGEQAVCGHRVLMKSHQLSKEREGASA